MSICQLSIADRLGRLAARKCKRAWRNRQALLGGVTILSHSFRFGGLSGRTRTYGLLLPTQACYRLHHTQPTWLD